MLYKVYDMDSLVLDNCISYLEKFHDYSIDGYIIIIAVAPFTQATHVRTKNSDIQGRSLNVIKVIFHTVRNCL